MLIPLLLLQVGLQLLEFASAITGFYPYQVGKVGSDLHLYCLSSGRDIKWYRKTSKQREELLAPSFKVTKSYICGNPHMCGGYDVMDTRVCLRSTLTLRGLQKSDIGTYFCQEGIKEGAYSYAYVLNVLSEISPPHIYDFSPLECNSTMWYGCVAAGEVSRYEYFISENYKKLTLHGTNNHTLVSGRSVKFVVRENYITLDDFTVLQLPGVKFGCRVFDRSGTFSEYQTGETIDNLEKKDDRGTYEAHLIKIISIGAGCIIGVLLVALVLCKLNQHCKRQGRRTSATATGAAAVQYSQIDSIPPPGTDQNVYVDVTGT